MRLIDAIHENRLLSRWAQLLPRPAAAIGSIHEADAELVPLDETRWLAVKVDTVARRSPRACTRTPRPLDASPSSRCSPTWRPSAQNRSGSCCRSYCLATTQRRCRRVWRRARLPPVGGRYRCPGWRHKLRRGTGNHRRWIRSHPGRPGATSRGIRAGDAVFVAGHVGLGGALAAARWLGVQGFTEERLRALSRIAAGQALRGVASAAMDTSDGSIATLDQLSRLNAWAFPSKRRSPACSIRRLRRCARLRGCRHLRLCEPPW